MEITVNVTGLDNLANAIMALANATGKQKEDVKMNTAAVASAVSQQQTQTPTAAVAPTTPVVPSTPAVSNAPAPSVTQSAASVAPSVNPVPTAAAAPTYTMEQLAVAATGLIDAGKMQDVQSIFANLGVQTLMELPQEKYGEFASAIKAIGAVI